MNIIRQLSGKVYPDHTFSIGSVPQPKIAQSEREYDRDYKSQFDSYSIAEYNHLGYEVKTETWCDGMAILNRFIKSPKSSHRPKRYGQQGITKNGKRVVKNCAVIMEKDYGVKRLGFVTCTMPSFDSYSISVVSANWGEVIRQFLQRVRRRLVKVGVPDDIIAVTEIQERRYQIYGDVCPHLHFLYVCRKRPHDKQFVISANELRLWWSDSINNVLSANQCSKFHYSEFASSIDCQVVKKSASSYLGKYMSKGGEIVADIIADGKGDQLPRQWWTATMALKKRYKSAIITLDQAFCSFVFYNLGDCLADDWFTWVSYVDVLIGDEYRTVGCVGILTDKTYSLLC